MDEPKSPAETLGPTHSSRVGRPRRGTEAERIDIIIAAATRVFLKDGYGAASIDKVAHEAGVSTRTIYERFRNKAELLASVITRLVERDVVTLFGAELERLPTRQALLTIGEIVTGRACTPDAAALFRIVAAEAQRFPALAAKMRAGTKARVDNAVANYLRGQALRGKLVLTDPDRAAALFMQMVCSELQECLLFGSPDEMVKLNFAAHLQQVVDIFLNGAAPRGNPDLMDAG
jgi:AcrR family transcriptional regulator